MYFYNISNFETLKGSVCIKCVCMCKVCINKMMQSNFGCDTEKCFACNMNIILFNDFLTHEYALYIIYIMRKQHCDYWTLMEVIKGKSRILIVKSAFFDLKNNQTIRNNEIFWYKNQCQSHFFPLTNMHKFYEGYKKILPFYLNFFMQT